MSIPPETRPEGIARDAEAHPLADRAVAAAGDVVTGASTFPDLEAVSAQPTAEFDPRDPLDRASFDATTVAVDAAAFADTATVAVDAAAVADVATVAVGSAVVADVATAAVGIGEVEALQDAPSKKEAVALEDAPYTNEAASLEIQPETNEALVLTEESGTSEAAAWTDDGTGATSEADRNELATAWVVAQPQRKVEERREHSQVKRTAEAGGWPGRGGRRRHAPIVMGGGLVALLAIAWVAGRTIRSEPADEAASGAELTDGAASFEAFDRGVAAIHQGDWRLAQAQLLEALASDPDRLEARRYLARVDRELAVTIAIEEARTCFVEGDVECTRKKLAGLDTETLAFEGEGMALLLELPDGTEGLAPEPAEPPRGGRPTSAKAASVDAASTKPVPTKAGATRAGSGRAKATSANAASMKLGSNRAGASVTGSARGVAAKSTGDEARRAATAEGEMDPAEAARRATQAGVRARLAGNLDRAVDHLENALRLHPGHAAATAELDSIREMLPEIFRDAYAGKGQDPEGSKRKLRLVIRLTDPGQELRAKAEKWLGRLESRG